MPKPRKSRKRTSGGGDRQQQLSLPLPAVSGGQQVITYKTRGGQSLTVYRRNGHFIKRSPRPPVDPMFAEGVEPEEQ